MYIVELAASDARLAGAVVGAFWVIGLPAFWPDNNLVPLFTSSIGLLIILLYIPGGFTQLGYGLRGTILRWLERRDVFYRCAATLVGVFLSPGANALDVAKTVLRPLGGRGGLGTHG